MKTVDFISKILIEENVRQVFGMIGGAATRLIDSLNSNGLEFVPFYHEQAAAYAATAAAKYSRQLNVAVATSGPGATNLITGIADAYFDSVPVLFLTGQVNTSDFKYEGKVRQLGFQETDIVNIVKPITKYASLVDNSNKLVHEVRKAISIAKSGRPGPVLLDIPMDIQAQFVEIDEENKEFNSNEPLKDQIKPDLARMVLEKIKQSKKPLILCGGGCCDLSTKELILKFVEKYKIPVVVSLMGKDSFPNDHPLYSGFVGAYGNRYANIAMVQSDLLLVLGSRLDTRQTGNNLAPFQKKCIIQVDIDENEMNQRVSNEISVVSSINSFLKTLLDFSIQDQEKKALNRSNWLFFLEQLKAKFPVIGEPIRAGVKEYHYNLAKEISDHLWEDDVICVDVGQNQMLAAQAIEIRKKQRFINSGGMAPMGYSLPAAIGISLQNNSKRSIVITGDGGFQVNIQELITVAKRKLPIIIFVFNNHSLGMIKQFQELYLDSRFVGTDSSGNYYHPDFVEIAKAYGIKAFKISANSKTWRRDVTNILDNSYGPVLVDVDLDYQTYIYPKLEFDNVIDSPLPDLSDLEKAGLQKLISKLNTEDQGV
ncbi:thiamine pyrophosphate protein central region [Petrotoga sp. 9T1HF07.CasAA.8.2]|uniref:thiamine pyrophosphate-binding protein n=1 Tax=Petrotoga sp. 9T1HF07.CasAA.8.2 TaxID=1434329 RepID=UPI000CB8BC39|nr:thiamine pyrophosphate-binding protein [Petrotoga sp. 9T1HF07.CasAA.8.2]PNR88781.1 thiamine pyrophosphate protein central region [Petrotoga sp. 9T1HF07.CasAA.8.2]